VKAISDRAGSVTMASGREVLKPIQRSQNGRIADRFNIAACYRLNPATLVQAALFTNCSTKELISICLERRLHHPLTYRWS
jgi:hypothetical protein